MIKNRLEQTIFDFLRHREIQDYKVNIYKRHIHQFYEYCNLKDVAFEKITNTIIEDYCYNRNESEETKRKRMIMMINFSVYLKLLGHEISIPQHRNPYRTKTQYTPYIYSQDELKRFFYAIDHWKLSKYANHTYRVKIDPLIFRMFYGCGLRLTEALHLKRKDIDMENGYLYIQNGKNGRDRIVPMASSLTERCSPYIDNYLYEGFDQDMYIFNFSDPRKIQHERALYGRFRQYLESANIEHTGHGPRIHDFRHTYAVHKMKEWVLNEKNLQKMLPYLSKYLGHVDFRGTEYYLRLTADLYPELTEKMETFEADIFSFEKAGI